MGAEGEVDGRRVAIGNERLFETRRIDIPKPWPAADRLRGEGKSLVFVAADGLTLGAIAVADRPRETARETRSSSCAAARRSVAMLTGDHEEPPPPSRASCSRRVPRGAASGTEARGDRIDARRPRRADDGG